MKECIVCKKEMDRPLINQKLCSRECRKVFYGRQGRLNIPTASVGSISEMMICSEMLKMGYSVFRTVSGASFCDVVAIKGDEHLLIEVRTGYKSLTGDISYPKVLHDRVASPTHYGIFIPQTGEIFIKKISNEEKIKHSTNKR